MKRLKVKTEGNILSRQARECAKLAAEYACNKAWDMELTVSVIRDGWIVRINRDREIVEYVTPVETKDVRIKFENGKWVKVKTPEF